MRRGIVALCTAGGLALGCAASEPVLPLPEREGVAWWVVVESRGDEVESAQVMTRDDALRLPLPSASRTTVEALAFAGPLTAPRGPLDLRSDGALLPEPATAFRVDGDEQPAWVEGPPSALARTVRLPPSADDCPSLSVRTEELDTVAPLGITAILSSDDDTRVVITPSAWYAVTTSSVRRVPPLVDDVRAASRDPTGSTWLITGEALWTTPRDLLAATATATRARAIPPGVVPFSIASPDPGAVYVLDQSGRLFLSTTATTVLLHQFAGEALAARGAVVDDGNGVLAGVGADPTFVRVEGRRVSAYTLPNASEGVVALARFEEYGVVVGTNSGRILAERLGFEAVPDPLDQLPGGVQIRVLVKTGDHLFFGGNSGLFGRITPRRFVCRSPLPASSALRFVTEMEGQILAGGIPFEAVSDKVYLTRFELR